ncbi:uncharacterized protein LOC124187749 isoform X2 [Neodiprion fabricii]|nr:uncharacterized protein LOC124187749 isoform X2 [Neodiprion fabricii]XP_046435811.1 uncharacterized protein LOC124187749 isoform X2 [Neodiprion fabricii]XP_046435822.1 uncharacterized protein LOC124187749 isoform X2 [Neodiprion fabricii]XP_046435832.1 uncharacterized protein LOC124187749 isoform X2 [Neodiprion fabricii]XP_046435838.1 uncharacterized protein LOC124187749 isoform X2 [Neodiprion fabricii]
MNWTQEECLQVINEYRKRKVLWNPRDPLYYNKITKEDAWTEIAVKCCRSTEELKKKIESLKSTYRREKTRARKRYKTGKGRSEIHQPQWFAYTSLQFLDNKNIPYKTLNNVQNMSDEIPTEHFNSESLDDSNNIGNQFKNEQIELENLQASDAEEALNTEKTEFSTLRTRVLKRNNIDQDQRNAEAFDYIRQVPARSDQLKDECSLFGDYIAAKLRKFDDRSRAIAEHRISNTLFDLEMNCGRCARARNWGSVRNAGDLIEMSDCDYAPVIHRNFPRYTVEMQQNLWMDGAVLATLKMVSIIRGT